MSEYFLKPKSSGEKVIVDLDLSNYPTKADFKKAKDVDTSKFHEKVCLASWETEINKSDIDKLKTKNQLV